MPDNKEFFLKDFQTISTTRNIELVRIANALVHPRGRGIYATDESPDVCEDILVAAHGTDEKASTRSEEEKRQRRKEWRKDAYMSLSSGRLHSSLSAQD